MCQGNRARPDHRRNTDGPLFTIGSEATSLINSCLSVRESKLQSQAKLVMDFDDGLEPVIPAVVGRKRKASKVNHQREKTKRARHSGEGKHPKINCGHRASNVSCRQTVR
ncbi:hypothetical protein QQF64_035962 [Cirrhinus molitorella]|uniref:Uncharacterized protein n=1 Tax=Cirrhinus molitorella TaxID=172907 RepID=A0ABR3NHD9_9TELE